MAAQSTLSLLGVRSATLGSSASLAVAFALSEGSVDPAAHTDATRIGLYASRTTGLEKVSVVVMGTEVMSAGTAGVTAATKVITAASTATSAGLNLPQGSAPTSPSNGDVWITSTGLFAQIAGATVGPFTSVTGAITGTLTSGRVPFSAGTSTVTDSAKLLFDTTNGATVDFGSSAPAAILTGTTFRLAQADSTASSMEGLSYGAAGLQIFGRGVGGTRASNSATTAAQTLLELQGFGFTTSLTSTASAKFTMAALGLWAVGNSSTYCAWTTTPASSTTPGEVMRLTSNLLIGGTTDISGTGGLKIFGTTVSTTTTSGALIVAGGMGIAGAIFAGGIVATPASTTTTAGLRAPHGSAPTAPTNGDIWTTTSGLFARINGATVAYTAQTANTVTGSLTSTRIPFASGAQALSDSATLVYAAATGMVLDLGAGTALPTATGGSILRLGNANSTTSGIEGYGYAATGLSLRGRFVGGTRASNSATTANAVIVNMEARGFTTAVTSSASGIFTINALNLWSASDSSTYCAWTTTPSASTTPGEVMRLTSNLLIGGTTDISGTGGLKVFGTTAATTTSSGALQVAGGASVAGAFYVGGKIVTATSTTSGAGFNVASGTAPTSPAAGDMWGDNTSLSYVINSTTFRLVQAPSAGLTSTRVPFSNSTSLTDSAQMTYATSTGMLLDAEVASGTLLTTLAGFHGLRIASGSGTNGRNPGVEMDGYGNTPNVNGTAYAGTRASPTATTNGQTLLNVAGNGYDGTSAAACVSISFVASTSGSAMTTSDHGGYISFSTTPLGSTTATAVARFSPNGNLLIGVTGDLSNGVTGGIKALGTVVVGNNNGSALATTATDGFLYIPTCAGPPTGVPTTQGTCVPMVYDSTNNNLYIYKSGWKKTTTFA